MSTHPELFPAKGGWKLMTPSGSPLAVPTLEEAAQALAGVPGAGAQLELLLPARLALFEMLTLPSADPEELEGMVELQVEKRLPYPLEETVHGFRVVGSGEGESRVLVAALHLPRLEALCEPLIAAGAYPERIGFQALRVGEATGEGVAAAIWCEEEDFVFGVFEEGCPLLVEVFEAPEQIQEEAVRLLMGASVAGASEAPGVLWVDSALRAEGEALRPLLGVRELQSLPERFSGRFPNLAPSHWRTAKERRARRQRLLHAAKVAGVAALGIAAAAFGLLAWKRHQLRSMEAELAALRPGMENLLVTQTRWNLLTPAIDPERTTVELLYRISGLLPSKEVRITEFQHELSGFRIRGEAPTPGEAVAYASKLKEADFLKRYTLETPPPTLLEGGKASFVILGK